MIRKSAVSTPFLSSAMVYSKEYLARWALVFRLSVSMDSSAAKALSGCVHITASAASIFLPASLSPHEQDAATAMDTATICRTIPYGFMYRSDFSLALVNSENNHFYPEEKNYRQNITNGG
ncbi:MAG: hypothetical protein PUK70_08715 [Bacteroidales bacterium]|nr:hypothetical protein [Bacteroidales bacterium]MDY6001130.1 hypothetical protein [Candidatus Cryptobacteroides sp.]